MLLLGQPCGVRRGLVSYKAYSSSDIERDLRKQASQEAVISELV